MNLIEIVKEAVFFSEVVAAITATIYFYKYKETPLKPFLFLLWWIVLCEGMTFVTIHYNILIFYDNEGRRFNLWTINVLYFVFFPFVLWIYSNYLSRPVHKKVVKVFAVLSLIATIYNWIFLQNFFFEYLFWPVVIGSIFLLISVIFYFIEVLKSERFFNFNKELMFWISIGLLIFHIGVLPFLTQINGYMLILIGEIHKMFYIVYILSNLMYWIFTFGFIWSKKY